MIIGEKIVLRPLKESDIECIVDIHNDLNIKKMAMFHPFPVTIKQDERWLENIINDTSNKSIYFAIENKRDRQFAGYLSLRNINWQNRNCFFGIVISPDFQGKGIGKEATKLILQYGIKILNLHKIQLEVISINEQAIKLYEKLGFIREGLLKHQYFFEGLYFDIIMMAYFREQL